MNFNFAAKLFRVVTFRRKRFDVYTDGTHKGRWGAWAFVVVYKGKVLHEASGRERRTDNQRMEFQAAIEAIRYLPEGSLATIHTDSRILINAATGKGKRPSVNADQIEVLEQLSLVNELSWNWVHAHTGVLFNERCDELCALAREPQLSDN